LIWVVFAILPHSCIWSCQTWYPWVMALNEIWVGYFCQHHPSSIMNGGGAHAHTPIVKSVSVVGDEAFRVRVCIPKSMPLS